MDDFLLAVDFAFGGATWCNYLIDLEIQLHVYILPTCYTRPAKGLERPPNRLSPIDEEVMVLPRYPPDKLHPLL